ncbi:MULTISPECIES: capsid protein [Cryobacterium]|uniref:Capsid protein n=1 Tax=Cryobacterium breve TaxID=1259258 RepID=A0ABY2J7K0_9MICO|nr:MULTISPECIES: capsid protein [Cryobacterium]TFC92051.1 capsid protein [Cryobacterium sp. TmT3-12]TFC99810.1 capsid protein [Cryobacterium breve]
MALPAANTAWPPAPWDLAYRAYAENEAWYLGDTDALEKIYRRAEQGDYSRRGTPMRGGIVGTASRMFWGRPVPAGQTRTRLHIPAAADLSTLSSDLLFSEPPEVQLAVAEVSGASASILVAGPSKEQQRLDLIANSDAAHAMFNTMGELKSALGATVITSAWDTDVADHVWLECTAVDVVVPEFRKGKLIACTMWTEYQSGSVFWRHLERHEPGRIEHALYQGTADNVGRRIPLEERPETAYLAKMVDGDSAILTGITGLTASYNLNMPTRSWRKKGELAFAGRSDYAGLHPLFDALDECMSSWMRDLKLGGGKILVPDAALQSNGIGAGGSFDMGQEAFAGLNMPGEVGKLAMEKVQFDIRVDEHEATAFALYREILRASGFSQSAWGDYSSGSAQTATEVNDRDKASERTRAKKTLYDKVAIAEQSAVALELDGILFPGKGGGYFERPTVVFPDVSQIDPEKLARTIQLLDAAGAASTRRKVELANADWTDAQVDEETERIRTDRGTVPDPATFTGFEPINPPDQEEPTP